MLLGAQYATGEQAGDARKGRSQGGNAVYNAGPLALSGIVDYYFSKRTDVYFEADYNKLGGALVGQSLIGNGIGSQQDRRLGLSLAIRHRF